MDIQTPTPPPPIVGHGFNVIARFMVRYDGKLLIGVPSEGLESGCVYELVDIAGLGQPMLVNLGVSALPVEQQNGDTNHICHCMHAALTVEA